MAVEYADSTTLENMIAQRINAAASWGGAIVKAIFSAEMIAEARKESALEVLTAIARSSKGHFGSLCAMVAVAHGAFLPAHDGEVGIPVIVPYDGSAARTGIPADPDEIDSYRANPSSYTGTSTGVVHAHDVAIGGKRSPLSLRYSIISEVLRFTGFSAEVPMMQITAAMADGKIPLGVSSTVVKLSIPKMVKPGTALWQFARADAADGRDDLVAIQQGAMTVKPPRAIADIMQTQRQSI